MSETIQVLQCCHPRCINPLGEFEMERIDTKRWNKWRLCRGCRNKKQNNMSTVNCAGCGELMNHTQKLYCEICRDIRSKIYQVEKHKRNKERKNV